MKYKNLGPDRNGNAFEYVETSAGDRPILALYGDGNHEVLLDLEQVEVLQELITEFLAKVKQ